MDRQERVHASDGYRRLPIAVLAADEPDAVPFTVDAYLKPAHTFLPTDVRVGPLEDCSPAHAALYRPRRA